ncbi:MAG: hypothetical protein HFJ65_07650 [Eggerthellaceae bacterium]|nr:hypothetical protein [Eggerthellaceae bacterium]
MGRARRSRRCEGFDYSSPGEYFVTFVTDERRCVLGEVEGEEVRLTRIGWACYERAHGMCTMFPTFSLAGLCIMPNHVHAMIRISPAPEEKWRAPLSRGVGWWKGRTTRDARMAGFLGDLWEQGFDDRIVRCEEQRREYLRYMQNNPLKWELDCMYRKEDLHRG